MRRSLGFLLAILGTAGVPAAAQTTDRARLAAVVDSIIGGAIGQGRLAGAAVAVVKGRDTLLVKGYGAADLELDVPTPTDGIYEIGSITKQFTAVAILQLVEQGKVSLDDDLTKYLPDYPTRGNRVTIRRLLDHTSGIKGYTEIPEARRMFMLPAPKDTVVAVFASRPFDFPPGDALVYNNSAYFLLGMVIEKASGTSYPDYVQKNLFEKAGMKDSRYCSETAITKGKVRGYNFGGSGLQKAFQQDHSWPYAAGSLCSTARDLVRWVRLLHTTDLLLTKASYRELITPGTLNDGTPLRYAKGLSVAEDDGRRLIAHGGGISGFVSESRYYPDEELAIVVLFNTAGPSSPGEVAAGIARTVLGPGKPSGAGVAYPGDLAELAGKYRGVGRGAPLEVTLSVEGGALRATMGNARNPVPLVYVGNDTFHGPGGRQRLKIVRDAGKPSGIVVDLVSVVSPAKRVQ